MNTSRYYRELAVKDFPSAVRFALNNCAVCRDHPIHQALLNGSLSTTSLQFFAEQIWHFHCMFPLVLSRLAESAPSGALRDNLTMLSVAQSPHRLDSPAALWQRVCTAVGLSDDRLATSEPATTTREMVDVQIAAADSPYWAGYLAIAAGVNGEAAPWSKLRCSALREHFGLDDAQLAYFSGSPGDWHVPSPDVLSSHVQDHLSPEYRSDAIARLEAVLRARWEFFTAAGRADADQR